jgi:dihydroorotase-like cyclic amidohydrolase
VRTGVIETIGTDNTARSRESKNPDGGVLGARPGYPMLATHLPAVLHHGHHEQGLPLDVLWRAISRRPAEVFGLYPRKGAIRLGSDADLVVVDLDREQRVDPARLGSFSDFSPFEGKTLRGWPAIVIKAGRIVARDGHLVDTPRGRYLPRSIRNRPSGVVPSAR